MPNKEGLTRRDFIKVAIAGVVALGANAACSKLGISIPIETPSPNASATPTETASETPTPSLTSTLTPTKSPTATETPTATPDILTPEKIAFLADHSIFFGKKSQKITIMTYDEGWPSENVESLLDIYRKYNAKCTFFMTGQGLAASRDIIPKLINEGHVLGCHSYVHDEMSAMDNTHLENQFKNWFDLKNQIVPGYEVKYFRAPYGSNNLRVRTFAARYGMRHIMWTAESGGLTDQSINYVFRDFKNFQNAYKAIGGAIVLSHTHRHYDISQAEKVLQKWEEMGYQAVTIDEGLENSDRWPPQI
jgi:peptidoglycan/xylan/chitin deacetylase (PgdA/CDA1 family)